MWLTYQFIWELILHISVQDQHQHTAHPHPDEIMISCHCLQRHIWCLVQEIHLSFKTATKVVILSTILHTQSCLLTILFEVREWYFLIMEPMPGWNLFRPKDNYTKNDAWTICIYYIIWVVKSHQHPKIHPFITLKCCSVCISMSQQFNMPFLHKIWIFAKTS